MEVLGPWHVPRPESASIRVAGKSNLGGSRQEKHSLSLSLYTHVLERGIELYIAYLQLVIESVQVAVTDGNFGKK